MFVLFINEVDFIWKKNWIPVDIPVINPVKISFNFRPYEFKLPAYMVHNQPDKPRQSNDGYLGSTNSDVKITYSVPTEKGINMTITELLLF